MKRNIQWALALLMLLPLLYACSTYKDSMTSFTTHIKEQDYEKAMQAIKANKILKKDRNALLYHLEMGKLYRLQHDYINSNKYLNTADLLMENNTKSMADIAWGNIINPMRQTYLGEDYEQYMMHFYKALNYAALGQADEAVVEARRIAIATNLISSKYNNPNNKYSKDAFALNIQGMIYEMAGDNNNAFIAYRNAVQLYQNNGGEYFGVSLPAQLKYDVLRTAKAMGFTEEVKYYEADWDITSNEEDTTAGSLILFVDDGIAPIKHENTFLLTANDNSINTFNYIDANGFNSNYNFNANVYGFNNDNLSAFKTFKLSLPASAVQTATPQNISVVVNNKTYHAAIAQNMNSIATNVMSERFLKEMGNALARQLTKKLLEKGTEKLAESIVKKVDEKKSTDTTAEAKKIAEAKKDERSNTVGSIAGLAVNMFNTINEKADTRNWQSLPAFVQYVRLPLAYGENIISIQTTKGIKTLKVNSNNRLQMMGVVLD